jgi:decaprenyl-phosphate phosphoribosyltransferase
LATADQRRSGLAMGLLKTARPKQWSKNLLVFAAPGAAGILTQITPLVRSFLAFVIFCVVASGTYFVNDAIDAEADRRHPTKRNRPIASGVLSPQAGWVIGVALLAAGASAGVLLSWKLGVTLGVYVALQFAYSYRLKHLPIYDLAAVAAGFILRCIAGGVATGVPVSEWFLLVATFGSLMMVTGKRMAEHSELGERRGAHRKSLDAYSMTFLNVVLGISAGGAILGYCLWAFSLQTALEHHGHPIWYQLSIVPMLLALLRYAYVVEGLGGGKPEDLVFADRSLQVLGLAWAALFALGIYAH